MGHYELYRLLRKRREGGRAYLEFLRVPALSAGLYELPAGGTDTQKPHTEDEVYYVIRGRAHVRVATEDTPVEPGSIIYVPAGIEHRFHTITEDLTLLVAFAPAEGSQDAGHPR